MGNQAEASRISVVVVDDHPLMREGIVQSLERAKDIIVKGQGGTADEAVDLAESILPDVMLIDVDIPGGGLNALERIAASCPAVHVIILTVHDDEDTVARALRMGAKGFLQKGIGGTELASTVRAVAGGDSYVSPALAARLIADETAQSAGAKERRQRLDQLTVRELQILRLLAKGLSNKEIGADLDLSEKTVKHYMTNILQKLQVRNRVAAALLATGGD